MATPTLRALRRHIGPSGHMIGVMRPYVGEVLEGTRWLDEEIHYRPGTKEGEHRPSVAAAKLRAAECDAVLLLTNSFRTGLMAWRSGAPVRIGYSDPLRWWTLTKRIPRPTVEGRRAKLPAIDSYLELAYALGCEPESPHLELATLPDDEVAADAAWQYLRLPSGDRVVVLNSGGAYGSSKQWPAEHFAVLARRLVREQGMHVLVNCGPAERKIARTIVDLAGDPNVVSLADLDVPLGLTKACIRRSRLLVTTDSGPRFFGIAFGKPVISLFGPTSVAMTDTHYDLESPMSLELDCQPCMQRTCPLGHHQCMRDLTVDIVYKAVAERLQAPAYSAA